MKPLHTTDSSAVAISPYKMPRDFIFFRNASEELPLDKSLILLFQQTLYYERQDYIYHMININKSY